MIAGCGQRGRLEFDGSMASREASLGLRRTYQKLGGLLI